MAIDRDLLRYVYTSAADAVHAVARGEPSEEVRDEMFTALADRCEGMDLQAQAGVIYAALTALADTWDNCRRAMAPHARLGGDDTPAFTVITPDGPVDDPDSLTAGCDCQDCERIRAAVWASRFAVAWANDDSEMAAALFTATTAPDVDPGPYALAMLEMAAAAMGQLACHLALQQIAPDAD